MSIRSIRIAILAGALGAVTLALAADGAALLPDRSGPDLRAIYLTDGPVYASLDELTRDSAAVVHARAVAVGRTYMVPFDPPRTVADPPPQGARPTPSPAPSRAGGASIQPAEPGLLFTDIAVEVVEVLRGEGVQPGQRLSVSQLGGSDRRVRPVVAEHDPLLRAGDQEVLFLKHDPASGKYFTTGGGQGRFRVAPNDTVEAVDRESPVGRMNHGRTLAALKAAVRTAR
jgi:hypothetical protein